MRLLRLLIVLTVQVTVLNQIHLFGYVTPLFLGYMLISCSKNTSRISLLLIGFFTGLLFDVFSNTAGMASAACTLQAMVQPQLLRLLTSYEAPEAFVPTIYTMGRWKYWVYAMLSMLTLHSAFYLLEAFTFYDWQLTLLSILGSTFFASLLCLFAELLVRKQR